MTRSQCVKRIEVIRGKIGELQGELKKCEEEVQRIDDARSKEILRKYAIGPDELLKLISEQETKNKVLLS